MCYSEKLNSLFFHTVKGEVKRIDNSNKSSVHRVVQVNPMEEGAEICPGSTLKMNRAGTDVLVLATHNKIMALVNVAYDGFESGVSINGLDGHPFSNFKPFGHDMVFGLSKTGMVSIHTYTDMSSAVIHTLLLPERVPHQSPLTTIVFDICSKDKYALICSHNEDMNREKLILLQIGSDFQPTIDTVHDFKKDDPSGELISSINMDFYCDGGPLAVCSELGGRKRLEAFHIKSINKVFENPGSSLGFSLKRKRRNLYSVDDKGGITKLGILPETPYASGYQNKLRDSRLQRSTSPGVLVSAGVTPSRRIPNFEPRPLKYSQNPEPRVISRKPLNGSIVSGLTPTKPANNIHTFRNTAPAKNRLTPQTIPRNKEPRIVNSTIVEKPRLSGTNTPTVIKQEPHRISRTYTPTALNPNDSRFTNRPAVSRFSPSYTPTRIQNPQPVINNPQNMSRTIVSPQPQPVTRMINNPQPHYVNPQPVYVNPQAQPVRTITNPQMLNRTVVSPQPQPVTRVVPQNTTPLRTSYPRTSNISSQPNYRPVTRTPNSRSPITRTVAYPDPEPNRKLFRDNPRPSRSYVDPNQPVIRRNIQPNTSKFYPLILQAMSIRENMTATQENSKINV